MSSFLKKALPGSLACLVSISFSLGKQGELAEIVVVETRSPKPEAEVSPWVTTLKESEWTFRQVEGVSRFCCARSRGFLGSLGASRFSGIFVFTGRE